MARVKKVASHPAVLKTRAGRDFLKDGFDLPKVEEKVLTFWKESGIFEKSLSKNIPQSSKLKAKTFVFYEGPPYANGKPGIHHVLARVVKDIILRFKTMQGFHVPRKGGWDTHGLPVEMAAEKALGLKSKKDIEQFGIQRFNEEAKKAVWLYKEEWERLTNRIGYWLDLKNAYVTYAPEYIESIWWTLSAIAKKKLLYKGHKVVPWCTRCGTSLSSHELAQGYKEVEDNSVYMKFRLKPGQKIALRQAQGKDDHSTTDDKTYILSWTTTPWTLPGNVALAVGENIDYTMIEFFNSNSAFGIHPGDKLILSEEIYRSFFQLDNQNWKKLLFYNPYGKNEDKSVVRLPQSSHFHKGKDLVGLEYEPLFKIPALKNGASYKIYPADFVTTTDGTGVVHTAVMYGEDDYNLGVKVGLPQHHTVTEEGTFTKEVPDLGGMPVKAKETEEAIFKHLEKHGNLLRTEAYKHEYPHCWRCGTPVLYFARDSWFIGMSKLRTQLLASNKKVHWVPGHVKDGRFGEWLREVKDWNLSRERYWGAPLPIWECKQCKTHEVIGSLDELDARMGGAKNTYYVVRHGESRANIKGILDASRKKYRLTTIGDDQAIEAGKKLKKTGIDIIIASDVERTVETARAIGKEIGVEHIVFDKRLREIHLGALIGCHDSEYHRLFPTLEDRFTKRPEGGESVRDLRARMWEALREYESKYSGKKILLVTHEYSIWMLTHVALGWSEEKAITEKEERGDDFIDFADPVELPLRVLPRNDSGEVDLHRPFVDAMTFPCKTCKRDMQRVREVADVWYDSGAMPFAQGHWPFEQVIGDRLKVIGLQPNTSHLTPPRAFPADYISEGVDQTRGWFYTLLAIATALGYEAPYKNVVCLGLINDKNGQKMSKSKGNIVEPFAVIDKYGVDAVRWYFYAATPAGDTKNFDEAEVGKTLRRIHMIVYNSLVFWQTYADKTMKNASSAPKSKNILDTWILARLDETIAMATKSLEAYEIREAALAIEILVDDLSRWYIRRSRRRLQKPVSKLDYASASATLGYVLLQLTKLMAPFTPFFSEAMYHGLKQQITNGKEQVESVHLGDWPEVSPNYKLQITRQLVMGMAEARRVSSVALAKRAELGIKVRQPLAMLTIKSRDAEFRTNPELLEIVREEVNVKDIRFDAKLSSELELDTVITPELRTEGLLRELVRAIQELRQAADLKPADRIVLLLEAPPARTGEPGGKLGALVQENEAFVKKEVNAKTIEYKRGKFSAEIITKIDGEDAWLGVRKVRT